MTHAISFDVRIQSCDEPAVITTCVDGVKLSALVEQFETSRGYCDPAGGYDGLVPEFF